MNHRIVRRRTLGWLTTTVFCGLILTSASAEVVVDGVPLPSDVTVNENAGPNSDVHRLFSGAWVGSWGDTLKHILVVERISDQGEASVIYAVGDLATAGRVRSWKRYNATLSGDTLTISSGFTATYKAVGNTLRAGFERGTSRSRAIMSKVEFATLMASGEHITWSKRQVEFLNTDLVENGTPVRLEVVLFKPEGAVLFRWLFSTTARQAQARGLNASREPRGILDWQSSFSIEDGWSPFRSVAAAVARMDSTMRGSLRHARMGIPAIRQGHCQGPTGHSVT